MGSGGGRTPPFRLRAVLPRSCVCPSKQTRDEWVAENVGVQPDYDVDQRPDREIAGHDPQLEKAIELVMDELKMEPASLRRPAYPRQRMARAAGERIAGGKQ